MTLAVITGAPAVALLLTLAAVFVFAGCWFSDHLGGGR